ncbi:MAG TPA: lysylphosphatidylglycerol synthase domain-containing protein [Thermoanaerobaculia bacterium]|nr:lysylphosphatidylglycerol synthase domain-containing protein [Thermoanaerobaculia bacterium]
MSALPPTVREAARRFGPWLVAAGLLLFLLHRVPFAALRSGLAHGPWGALTAYTFPLAALTLVADAFATQVCLAVTGEPRPFRTLLLVRGATYLLGLVNYALGQGGIGLYLHRTGTRAARGTGIVLFLMAVNLGSLALTAALGLVLPVGNRLGPEVRDLVLGGLVLGALYLGVVALRPAFLNRYEILSPLFAAGVRGHLAALAGRLPHVLLLALGQWGALWIWGVRIPADHALALMPLVLVVAALPVAPAGLGTLQAAQVLLFAHYASEAAVLSFSLAFSLLGLVFQAIVGVACLAALKRRGME